MISWFLFGCSERGSSVAKSQPPRSVVFFFFLVVVLRQGVFHSILNCCSHTPDTFLILLHHLPVLGLHLLTQLIWYVGINPRPQKCMQILCQLSISHQSSYLKILFLGLFHRKYVPSGATKSELTTIETQHEKSNFCTLYKAQELVHHRQSTSACFVVQGTKFHGL